MVDELVFDQISRRSLYGFNKAHQALIKDVRSEFKSPAEVHKQTPTSKKR